MLLFSRQTKQEVEREVVMFVAVGLILATFFGMFFGSEGEMNEGLFNAIFWGLIGAGVMAEALEVVRENVCHNHHFHFCHHQT